MCIHCSSFLDGHCTRVGVGYIVRCLAAAAAVVDKVRRTDVVAVWRLLLIEFQIFLHQKADTKSGR